MLEMGEFELLQSGCLFVCVRRARVQYMGVMGIYARVHVWVVVSVFISIFDLKIYLRFIQHLSV